MIMLYIACRYMNMTGRIAESLMKIRNILFLISFLQKLQLFGNVTCLPALIVSHVTAQNTM